ncbi:MAG: hypothetical protein JSV91_13840 [Phycisphaerales bacterium]|nr:MAG: hypothetical protein JSV91_13840 [Phycisphaerales bacterium]
MRKAFLLAGLFGAAVCGDIAFGGLTILKDDGTEATTAEATKTYNPDTGGWDIHLLQLYAPWGETIYDIHGDGGETIDTLFIEVDGPPAGSPLMVKVLSDDPSGIKTVHNILQTGSAETLLLTVDVREDIGSVEAEVIGSMLAGRDIVGPIIATTGDNPSRGVTWAIAQRYLLGDVIAANGRIGGIRGFCGIGSAAKPVTIAAKYKINGIGGWGNVYANINTRANGGEGGIFSFYAERFFGAFETEAVIHDGYTGTPGRMVIKYEFDGLINIGKSHIDPEQWLELPPDGLAGQIIINGDGDSSGAWTAPVYLGPDGDPNRILLDAPHYTRPAEMMNRGSVGLVPFALHDESCLPANGEAVTFDESEPLTELRLRHYGPVRWDASPPVAVARRLAGSGGSFIVMPSHLFEYLPADDDPNTIVVRPVGRAACIEPGYEYRVQPNALLLSDVPAQPPVQWDQDYQIVVEIPPCEGDLTADGQVNIDDLFMVLAHWGPVGGGGSAADLDGNGVVNIDDLFAVLALWGPCS